VPRVLTIDQKQQRVDDSEQCLAIFNRNKDEFFRRYITMDASWLLHYTSESNRQSALNAMNRIQSVERRNGPLERLLHQYSGMHVVLFIDYFKKSQTINSEYYIALYWSV
jgi:hypothetical protein